MNTDYLEEILRSLDPATESEVRRPSQEDEVWLSIVQSLTAKESRRPRRYEVAGGLGAAAVAIAVLVVSLGGAPTTAVAATLQRAATEDSAAANLPALGAGQFYYQTSQISLTCEITSPHMSPGEAPLTYIADGTMESWTNGSGGGTVVISPSQVDGGGSHFATPEDQARWVALGEPVIPCALVNSSNEFGGNSANSDASGSLGGFSTSVSGYGGFGLSLAMASQTSLVSASSSINDLPSDPAQISSLLANGQISPDGAIASNPQACPIQDGSSASVGCSPSEQLSVIEQLIQLPDASAKLGSVLYQVIANLPGASDRGSVTNSTGVAGSVISVPQGSDEAFEVVLDPTTGELLSCSELLTQDGVAATIGSVQYGSVQVVNGQGALPGD